MFAGPIVRELGITLARNLVTCPLAFLTVLVRKHMSSLSAQTCESKMHCSGVNRRVVYKRISTLRRELNYVPINYVPIKEPTAWAEPSERISADIRGNAGDFAVRSSVLRSTWRWARRFTGHGELFEDRSERGLDRTSLTRGFVREKSMTAKDAKKIRGDR